MSPHYSRQKEDLTSMTNSIDVELETLRPPAGFTYDPEALRLHGVVEYRGGHAYTTCRELGAGAIWTPEDGIKLWLDVKDGHDYTRPQVREFHAALGRLLEACG